MFCCDSCFLRQRRNRKGCLPSIRGLLWLDHRIRHSEGMLRLCEGDDERDEMRQESGLSDGLYGGKERNGRKGNAEPLRRNR